MRLTNLIRVTYTITGPVSSGHRGSSSGSPSPTSSAFSRATQSNQLTPSGRNLTCTPPCPCLTAPANASSSPPSSTSSALNTLIPQHDRRTTASLSRKLALSIPRATSLAWSSQSHCQRHRKRPPCARSTHSCIRTHVFCSCVQGKRKR